LKGPSDVFTELQRKIKIKIRISKMSLSGLAKNSVITLIANISLALSNWLILVIIAKHYDGARLGEFVLALSIASPLFLFASFKIRTLVIVDKYWNYKLEEYANARLLANIIVTLLLALAAIATLEVPLQLIMIVVLYKWFDTWSEFCQSYMRRVNAYKTASVSLSIRSILTILSVVIITFTFSSFEPMLIAWCLVAGFFAAFDTYSMYKLTQLHEMRPFSGTLVLSIYSIKRSIQLYKQYFTVAIALLISALFVYLPNFLLNYKLGIVEAGQFATISYFLVAGGILINSLSQAATPQLVSLHKSNNETAFVSLVVKLCGLGISIGIAGVIVAYFCGEYFLTLFYNSDIGQHADVLLWVMMAAAIRYVYIFIGTSYASLQLFHIQTKIYGVGLVVMFFSCLLLIEANGIVGAAQAMFAATVCEFILFGLLTKNQYRKVFEDR
jgi:O-antigen/teichoic acid export membrane protein